MGSQTAHSSIKEKTPFFPFANHNCLILKESLMLDLSNHQCANDICCVICSWED